MRFLFLTDTHLRGTTPRNRRDNFLQTLEEKLAEVVELGEELGVTAVLHNGDLFDRPDVSPSIVRQFATILRRCPSPIYGIAGNHDLFGQNPETLPRTMLGLLDGFGIIRLIHPGQVLFFKEDGVTVQLTGQHFHYDIDRRDPALDYFIRKDPAADFAVHMVHGMLLDKPFLEGIPHTLVERIARTEADVTLGGHYHSGFKRVEIDGKLFVNPGSLVRINNSLAEISRVPKVVLLEFTAGKGMVVQEVELKRALPGDQVLDRKQIELLAARERKFARFVQGVRAAGEFTAVHVPEIVDEIARTTGIRPGVRDEAIRRISAAQEAVGEAGEEE